VDQAARENLILHKTPGFAEGGMVSLVQSLLVQGHEIRIPKIGLYVQDHTASERYVVGCSRPHEPLLITDVF
jgi:hypothetical protein